MSAVLAAAAGFATWEVLRLRRPRHAAVLGIGVGAVLWQPVLAAGVLAALGAVLARNRLAARRVAASRAAADVPMLAELVAMGLRAGDGLPGALQRAAAEVDPGLAAEVHAVLRDARHRGLAQALADAEGDARDLYRLAARAVVTGAPIAGAVDAFLRDRRHAERARAEEDARKLSVRLMIPVALLILPGFVLLTVGPAVLGALDSLRI